MFLVLRRIFFFPPCTSVSLFRSFLADLCGFVPFFPKCAVDLWSGFLRFFTYPTISSCFPPAQGLGTTPCWSQTAPGPWLTWPTAGTWPRSCSTSALRAVGEHPWGLGKWNRAPVLPLKEPWAFQALQSVCMAKEHSRLGRKKEMSRREANVLMGLWKRKGRLRRKKKVS